MNTPDDVIRLIEVSAALREAYGSQVTYNLLWHGAIYGGFPAHRIKQRWYVKKADLPLIAAHFGLPAPAVA